MMLRIIHASIYTMILALTAPVTAAMERLPPFFHCKSESDRTLELYKQNNTISYKFGSSQTLGEERVDSQGSR